MLTPNLNGLREIIMEKPENELCDMQKGLLTELAAIEHVMGKGVNDPKLKAIIENAKIPDTNVYLTSGPKDICPCCGNKNVQ